VSDVLDILQTSSFGLHKRLISPTDVCLLVCVFAFRYIKKSFIYFTFAKLAVGRPPKNIGPICQLLQQTGLKVFKSLVLLFNVTRTQLIREVAAESVVSLW
jgi:hypothetical protein